jgi:leucyl aminopeptidase
VSDNSYRPLDIITSRKGLTVEIGNTDAEGRLVLADCMHWTQEKFKCKDLIELSTLTGAIIIALGKKHAGLFSNSDDLSNKLISLGNQIG